MTSREAAAPPESTLTDPLRANQDPWQWWRSHMPITRKWTYFDHAAVGPLSGPAAAAIQRFLDQASLEGDTVWPSWNRQLGVLRGQVAELIHADPEEICLIPNTTTGVNLVAEGWEWQPGDSVVLPEGEFPSNLFPWLQQKSRGLDVRQVARRSGRVEVDDLLAASDDSTRMFAVSWTGYSSGFRVDLDQLVQRAHERGILVFLDAIQGLGIHDLDLQKTPVDFLAADGHKWLLGPEGAGVAMIRREHLKRIRCLGIGWHSVRQAHQFSAAEMELRPDAIRFEGGSSNMVGMAALSASMDLFLQVIRQHGPTAISDRIRFLAEMLHERLTSRGCQSRFPRQVENQSGIVTFEVPGIDPIQVREAALEASIVVSCRGGGVRASIHAYNTEQEIDRLVELVSHLS